MQYKYNIGWTERKIAKDYNITVITLRCLRKEMSELVDEGH